MSGIDDRRRSAPALSGLSVALKFQRGPFALDAALEIPGEGICVLLGPSGSGKTTLMRLIAGLDRPREGRVALGPQIWCDSAAGVNLPVRKRRVGVVFQDYALFENMTVAQNIGYGAPKASRAAEVASWIERLDLTGLDRRYPAQLSGGQRQRVALARALAAEPDLLLLDEPFSAVDAHLRASLRAQLMGLAAAVKKPVVMVTHDLEEARQVADTVGVMVGGRLRRFGPSTEVFDDPGDHAAACVLGWRNLLKLEICAGRMLAGAWGSVRLSEPTPIEAPWLGIRPEHLSLNAPPGEGAEAVAVRVRELGAVRELQCRLIDGTLLVAHRPWNEPLPAPGERLRIGFPTQHLRLLGDEGAHLRCRLGEAEALDVAESA